MTDDELTPEQRDALAAARVPIPPPAGLDDRAVAALRERGLIAPPRRTVVMGWFAVAATLLLAAGWFGTGWFATRSAPTVAQPQFMLLLYADSDASPSELEARRDEYSTWARGVAGRGVSISGAELSAEASQINADGSVVPAAFPMPRGYFIIGAHDLAAAQAIASSCPHLRHGGRIVIKRVS
jgi:hypothetical protein